MRQLTGPFVLGVVTLSALTGQWGCQPSRSSKSEREEPAYRIRLGSSVLSDGAAAPSYDASVEEPRLRIEGLGARADEAPLSAGGCRLDRPSGDCDRCPDRSCRQVLVMHDGAVEWRPFCDALNLREEARIACRCAGGNDRACRSSAMDTARALLVVRNMFGGDVPRVGQRYRDANGLKRVIGIEEHEWLALRVTAPMTLRCDPPEPAAADARYAECERWARARH